MASRLHGCAFPAFHRCRAAGKPPLDKDQVVADISTMDIPKNELLRLALGRDLSPTSSKESIQVTDDSVRKVFTANKDGAVLVFGHSQPDAAYWNGVKHYGSGPSSRIRVRRTQVVKAAKAPKAAKVPAAQVE